MGNIEALFLIGVLLIIAKVSLNLFSVLITKAVPIGILLIGAAFVWDYAEKNKKTIRVDSTRIERSIEDLRKQTVKTVKEVRDAVQ